MGMQVITQQITMLAVIMLIGFIGVKTKYLKPELKDSISKLILTITLPLLNITSITGQTLRPEMMRNAGILVAIELVAIGLFFTIGYLGAKLFRLPLQTRVIHTCMSGTGNVVFLGYPLINALYGAEGLFYAIVYALVNDLFVWTLCVFLISKSGGGSTKAGLKKLINPNTIAFLIALCMLALGLRLPDFLHNTFASIGSTTTCLSMLFIGMTLAIIDLKGIYKQCSIYTIVVFKMLIAPILLTYVLAKFSLDKIMLGALILELAMPVQTVLTIVANEFNSDARYATECVFITTVLSLVTLPAVYWFISQIV
ncbi:MAG: AEC family transporter [Ruminococcaceae bacterium]|nr:AEC family transporter [Oscillospiraceae bacterium]